MKNLLKITPFLFLTVLLWNCGSPNKEIDPTEEVLSAEEAEEPLQGNEIDFSDLTVENLIPIDTELNNFLAEEAAISKSLKSSASKIPTKWTELTDIVSRSKIFIGSRNGTLTIPGVGISLEQNQSAAVAYNIRYKLVNEGDSTYVYGSGYAIFYTFRELKRGLSASNIPQIAASVELGDKKTSVQVDVYSIGLASDELFDAFIPIVDLKLNVMGYSDVQSKIELINNILKDKELFKRVLVTPRKIEWLSAKELK